MAARPEAPCKGCSNRFIEGTTTCHSTCKDYIDFKRGKLELNSKIRKEKEKELWRR